MDNNGITHELTKEDLNRWINNIKILIKITFDCALIIGLLSIPIIYFNIMFNQFNDIL